MNILKTLQRLEAAAEMCSGKQKFLKCQKILKDYKFKQNPLKMLKGLKECFFGKVGGPQSSTLSKTPLQIFFNLFIYLLRVTAYQGKLLRKMYEF